MFHRGEGVNSFGDKLGILLAAKKRIDVFRVNIKVEIPKGLNDKQKGLLKNFDDNVDASKYKQSKSFFDKMKES